MMVMPMGMMMVVMAVSGAMTNAGISVGAVRVGVRGVFIDRCLVCR